MVNLQIDLLVDGPLITKPETAPEGDQGAFGPYRSLQSATFACALPQVPVEKVVDGLEIDTPEAFDCILLLQDLEAEPKLVSLSQHL